MTRFVWCSGLHSSSLSLQVETITVNGYDTIYSVERGCTKECYYGCRYNGYGVTYKRCYSCCRSNLCNTDNAAPSLRQNLSLTFFCAAQIIVLSMEKANVAKKDQT